MSLFQQMIQDATGCTPAEAILAEEIMRQDLFHSTLDWQPKAIFDKAARLAVAWLRGERVPPAVARAIQCGVPVALR